MKEALVAMENEGPVSLSKFHEHSLDGGWQFSTSYAYCCHLGAVDETERLTKKGGGKVCDEQVNRENIAFKMQMSRQKEIRRMD